MLSPRSYMLDFFNDTTISNLTLEEKVRFQISMGCFFASKSGHCLMSKILLLFVDCQSFFLENYSLFSFQQGSIENIFLVEEDLIEKPLLSMFASKQDSLKFQKLVEKMIQLDSRNVIFPSLQLNFVKQKLYQKPHSRRA